MAALFNLMNRLVEGLGIEASPDYVADAAEPLQTTGYAAYARRLKAGGARGLKAGAPAASRPVAPGPEAP